MDLKFLGVLIPNGMAYKKVISPKKIKSSWLGVRSIKKVYKKPTRLNKDTNWMYFNLVVSDR